jgi:large subunit ribosomal protein L9
MEVILSKDVPNVGRVGQIVIVSSGYARNFLLPRDLAVVASRSNKKFHEHQKRLVEAQKRKIRSASEGFAAEISKLNIKLKKRFNEQEKMFGSLSESEILDELKKLGHSFDRRDLVIGDIREAGEHKIKVRLPGDVYAELSLSIEAMKVDSKKPKKAKSEKKTKSAKNLEAAPETEDLEVEDTKSEE